MSSPSNPLVREALAVKKRRGRRDEREYLVEGPRLIEAAVVSGLRPAMVFFTSAFRSRDEAGLLRRIEAAETGATLVMVPERVLGRLADTETPQGVVAVVSLPHRLLVDIRPAGTALLVVSDGIQDPGNVGTIIRAADAAGGDGIIILPGSCDPFESKALRATAGSVFTLPIAWASADEAAEFLLSRDIALIIADANATLSVFEADLTGPVAIVLGNETRGPSDAMRKRAACSVRIPLYGRAESLNVAMAGTVIFYEAVRQRGLEAQRAMYRDKT